MPVATRSTTRKTRSLTVYAKPPPVPVMATKGAPKPSSKTTSRASKRKLTPTPTTNLEHKTKRSRKVADVDPAAAARRAENAAQAEKMRLEWEATVAEHPPCTVLAAKDLPGPGKTVPHRLYGWPFSEDYMLDYARRHELKFPFHPYYRKLFGDKDEFNFRDLTDDHLADKKSLPTLRRIATFQVVLHLTREARALGLTVERPVSLEWQNILVVWSTDNYKEGYGMYAQFGTWKRVEKFIDDAMNECLPEGCQRRTSLAWWWSHRNRFME